MKSTYTALAALLANVGSVQGNERFPEIGPAELKRVLAEALPNSVCCAYGSITGTGAAIKIGSNAAAGGDNVVNADFAKFDTCVLAVVLNKTDGTIFVHSAGMADASYFEMILASAYVSADGITLRTNGITIGSAAALNTNDDELFYIVFGR